LLYDRYNFGEDMIWTSGDHTVRFGGQATRQYARAIQNSPAAGEWTFTSISNFLQGLGDQYFGLQTQTRLTNGQTIPGTDGQRDWLEYQYVAYVQDDWRVRPNLTANLGLRYAPTSNPIEIHHQMTHIIPVPAFMGSQSCTVGTADCSAIGT
jgi:outer membrane receptor protein involved in Fe transport